MDKRFLIYTGFANEGKAFFKTILEKFNMKVISISDYGMSMENNRVILEISYETGLQIWIKNKKYNIRELLPKLAMFKGDYLSYKNSVMHFESNKPETFIKLADFLVEKFSAELSEIVLEN